MSTSKSDFTCFVPSSSLSSFLPKYFVAFDRLAGLNLCESLTNQFGVWPMRRFVDYKLERQSSVALDPSILAMKAAVAVAEFYRLLTRAGLPTQSLYK